MRVQEYRAICSKVRDMTVHYHACINKEERIRWASRARVVAHEGLEATCPRAGELDRQKLGSALRELLLLVGAVEASVVETRNTAKEQSSTSRSVRRVVRINRASRSARRHGYH